MRFLARLTLALAILGPATIAASPAEAAAPRHYDCSKPGNANKAECKNASSSSAAKATPSKTTTTKTTTTTTTRHYDCTKPGNANKAQCKTAAKESATGKTKGAVTKTTNTSTTTTDCTKWYNKARAVCKTTSSSSAPKTSVAPASKPVAKTSGGSGSATGGTGESVNNNPKGAIAQCKDGSYSHAAHRSGACSRHGGVAKWLVG